MVLALSLISHTVVVTVQYERGSEREDLLTRCFSHASSHCEIWDGKEVAGSMLLHKEGSIAVRYLGKGEEHCLDDIAWFRNRCRCF